MRHLGRITSAIVLSAAALVAQDSGKAFRQAPMGVEEALKARVMEFFNLQQEGKFRQAEALVCEDTKDHYYNMDKQRHKGAQFVKIFFEDDFKSAKAQVNLDIDLNTLRGPFPAMFPMMSYWRVENANWCYYIPKRNQDYYETPFGLMKRDPNAPSGAAPPQSPMVTPEMLKSAVKLSRRTIDLNAFRESTEEVVIQNTLPGDTEVEIQVPELPGLSASFPVKSLKAGETAPLKITFRPVSKQPMPPVSIQVIAGPVSQVEEIRITFDNRPPA